MKQQLKFLAATIVLFFFSFTSFAQSEAGATSSSKWVSDKGYWVIESNTNEPLQHAIRFYTNENVLVYKEAVTGIKLNPAKRKVKKMLKQVLETSLLAWEKNKTAEENMNYVLAILK